MSGTTRKIAQEVRNLMMDRWTEGEAIEEVAAANDLTIGTVQSVYASSKAGEVTYINDGPFGGPDDPFAGV